MELEVRPCSRSDLRTLEGKGVAPRELGLVESRYAWQKLGDAVQLLAWIEGEYVGRATLLMRSKYSSVQDLIGEIPEVNALEASLRGRGVGTALLDEAERQATQFGATAIGLAVEPSNASAIRLYAHRGFVEWQHGTVVDSWNEVDEGGKLVATHDDICTYMTKELSP